MRGRGNGGSGEVRREWRRGLADFMLALSLFWAVAFVADGSDIRAHAVPLPAFGKQTIHSSGADSQLVSAHAAAPAFGLYKTQAAGARDLALLSVAFAALFAGNLAFWRHLRRVYASPRRSVWRRG